MMINLDKIFHSCNHRNTNSKYCNKIWHLFKYSLLLAT